jgi:hypothetical protein
MSFSSTFNNIEKKIVLTKLPIPREIVRLVNDYVFHSEGTSPVMQKIRNAKNSFCRVIRDNSSRESGDHPEETWTFILSISTASIYSDLFNLDINLLHPGIFDDLNDYTPPSIEYTFNGRNCKVCGDYKYFYSYYAEFTRGISRQNACKCILV